MSPPPPTPSTVIKRKKQKYPTLANELALMQFADGGNMDSHIKRLMNAHASAAAGSHAPAGVPDVYRDTAGAVWWDQDEEWEYAHLLPLEKSPTTANTADRDWVRFDDRRGSVSTQASSLDARHVVRPMDEDALAAFGSALPPRALRSRRLHPIHNHPQQLPQPRPDFLCAFTPRSPASPAPPTSKSKTRRRPAPLNLASPPGGARRARPYSPVDADKARRDFIAGSFAPVPPVPPIPPVPAAATNVRKARMRGMSLARLFKKRV